MSIKVRKITKLYGEQKALDSVSFEIKPGQIVGLLGPNGAGKSTMMKIITCFIPPSDGEAFVNNINVLEKPLEVKKITGYLPENNPLYLEMYVKEYLEFVGRVYKLPDLKSRVAEMIELTGLADEQHKKLEALSKGYRQRVGLAQALIHEPEVLILDEPTSGLDPNQLVEIRNLIKTIGKKKTVMLSTHIMQEVEAICDRVIIIHKGKIVADKNMADLRNTEKDEETILVEFNKAVNKKQLSTLPTNSIQLHKGNTWKIKAGPNDDIRNDLFKLASKLGINIISLQKQENTLEEIFQSLTKS
jgi:ABC-2 type transport system ATP-binding protein